MERPRVGFIGLGTMGEPMARNVLRGGFPLTVYDRRSEPVQRLVQVGASAGASPQDVAERSDIVITMLPDSPDVEAVVLGPEGVLAGLRPGAVYIDMSTIDPRVTRRLAEQVQSRGAEMLDAPVGRGSAEAAAGRLLIMVGGDPAVVERCRPVLLTMGDTIYYCGPLGSGITVKVVNNLLSASILVATAEAVVLGVRAGVAVETLLKVLSGTAAANWHLANTFRRKVFAGDFQPGFKIDLAYKDLGLALGLAGDLRVPTPVGALCRELYNLARAQDKGALDWGAYIQLLEELTGVRARYAAGEPANTLTSLEET